MKPPSDERERLDRASEEAVATLTSEVSKGEALSDLSESSVRSLLTLAVQAYAERAQLHGPVPALDREAEVTVTQVAITVTALLEAIDMELFELAMWHSLGRPT